MEDVKDPIITDPVTRESPFEKRMNTILLSVCTAMILITVNFLWNLKGDFAALQEREKAKESTMDAMQASMNKMQLDIEDLKQRNTRIETIIQSKSTK